MRGSLLQNYIWVNVDGYWGHGAIGVEGSQDGAAHLALSIAEGPKESVLQQQARRFPDVCNLRRVCAQSLVIQLDGDGRVLSSGYWRMHFPPTFPPSLSHRKTRAAAQLRACACKAAARLRQ